MRVHKTMSESARSIEQRLDELEFRIAFQEDTITQLNDVITLQRDELDQLKRQLTDVVETLQSAVQTGGSPSEIDERPPHY